MTSTATLPSSATPPNGGADALAWAETRRLMVQRLASLGMTLAEEVTERAVNSPYHPEPRHEPARAFAAISRAVRLTLVLEARICADVLALRNGLPAPGIQPPARAPRSERPAVARDAADDETGDPVVEADARDRCGESLIEREEDEDLLLDQPFDACVETIRETLDLVSGSGQGWSKSGVGSWDAAPDAPADAGSAIPLGAGGPIPSTTGRETGLYSTPPPLAPWRPRSSP